MEESREGRLEDETQCFPRTEQINLQNRGPAKPNFLVPRNLGTGAPLSGRGPSSSEKPAKQLL